MPAPTQAVFIGDGTLLIRCAEAWLGAGHAIAAVASRLPAIRDWARARGLPLAGLRELAAGTDRVFDYLFSVVNLQLLPASLLAQARRLALNFHDGPLPRYAGLHATSWALLCGETRHGVTWHEMTAAVDRGRIARQQLFDLAPDETALSLNARCYEAGFETFRALMDDLAAERLALREPAGPASYFGRHLRPPALATLDWSWRASQLADLARALDLGPYPQPLALPKLWTGRRLLRVREVQAEREAAPAANASPGTVLGLGQGMLRVATAQGVACLSGLQALDDDAAAPLAGLAVGQVLPALAPPVRERLSQALPQLARAEAAWRPVLERLVPLALPYPAQRGEPAASLPAQLRLPLDAPHLGPATVAALCAWLAALTGQEQVAVLYTDAVLAQQTQGLDPWASGWVPLALRVVPQRRLAQVVALGRARIARAHRAGPLTADLRWRLGTDRPAPWPRVGVTLGGDAPAPGLALVLRAESAGGPWSLQVDAAVFAPPVAHVIARHLEAWLRAFAGGTGRVGELPLCPPIEAAQVLAVNDTAVQVDTARSALDRLTEAAQRQPEAVALAWGSQRLTHAALQQRAQALAQALRARGVGPGARVGLCLARSPDLVAAVLAVWRCGAAYLPLDPTHPAARLRWMLEDAQATVLVAEAATAEDLGWPAPQRLVPSQLPWQASSPLASQALSHASSPLAGDAASWPVVTGRDEAYAIYTSGSTGRPKGVRISHANLLNFFAGMDACVPAAGGGRWLAVTRLAFDIAVLELLWTLSRGFTVVLAPEAVPAAPARAAPAFSLFHFGCEGRAGEAAEAYRLLREGARFADRHGFEAVWTPERHFHAFGGPYPNPAVIGAALAVLTTRVRIRAGSCVLPLHHPLRVAEDWAVVDQLSGGRVDLSFAAGWQPQDFALAPQAFETRRRGLFEAVSVVRRLWRGETLAFPGPQGEVRVRTLPRPVQPELPVWITTAGQAATFVEAGAAGCHVLTHLLGQSLDDVTRRIADYRAARRAAGHPGPGRVTLMLHTFVGADDGATREAARAPLKAYLRQAVDLIRDAAWTFPTFVQRAAADGRTPLQVMQERPLDEAEMDALLEHAFARYADGSALIGDPARCAALVRRAWAAGVDEIACLIDFGLPVDTVLAHLADLADLRMQVVQAMQAAPAAPAAVPAPSPAADGPLAWVALMREQGITHLQCTPSLATLLAADEAGREALRRLSVLLVGGEAVPAPLARELRALVPGRVLAMYGPTETTVWSACAPIDEVGDFVPLGEPIANTRLHVRNAWGGECPALVPGELWIGGAGVALGYLGAPAAEAERFQPDPARPGERLYRTGDRVCRHPDGRLEFLGRVDHQVKLRGHRIELGEVEAVLARQPGVREAVVLVVTGAAQLPGLEAHVTAQPGQPAPDPQDLRHRLARELPAVMCPQRITLHERLPLNRNGKVDRQALAAGTPAVASPVPVPAPSQAPSLPASPSQSQSPSPSPSQQTQTLEQLVAATWCAVLGCREVGRDRNFFDLGGHSLAVVQVQRRLREATGQEIALIDLFRLTTVADQARHLAAGAAGAGAGAVTAGLWSQAQGRAQVRRQRRAPVRTA